MGFSSRPFVLCGLPVRKPPKGTTLYERRNGNFVLEITGHPNYGLPFGQDRIVPIYLAGDDLPEDGATACSGTEVRSISAISFAVISSSTLLVPSDTIASKFELIATGNAILRRKIPVTSIENIIVP